MKIPKNLCWNITYRCNSDCRFCYRAAENTECSLEENLIVLKHLKQAGVTEVTWTGGEALLYDQLPRLLIAAKELNIKNMLITNSKLLDKEMIDLIAPYLDTLTFSLDSHSDYINESLGRGAGQYNKVEKAISYLKKSYPQVKVKINSLACKETLQTFQDLARVLSHWEIDCWRIFRFINLRGTAKKHEAQFSITDREFQELVTMLDRKISISDYIPSVDYIDHNAIEADYLLISPSADLFVTRNKKDILLGNLLNTELNKLV